MEYRELLREEINLELFGAFERYQQVTKRLRKSEGKWIIEEHAFIDQWSREDYITLVKCLRNTIEENGVVYGAFYDGKLKGFASVEGKPIGSRKQYYDLSSLHVSREMRGRGIGSELFSLACLWVKSRGGEKLYISSHSAVETQAFYKAVGCVEAEEYNREHAEKEPYDCQLERDLTN